ncbi:(2Fe-2S)-binding protein [Chryseobacterium sp. SSA4.19]|uniref:(2Fe-2S)-binding protein n=1 Tax=Chryseobacterium sp. SSA4.19 TaxID=2919915 RepID=UPI001F4E7E57|nr:(2Fe-2S)-binding protein [Chryseobacterium sp. SSA4.19]MCJ8152738.1 (2Fe-2S)-binding protein [Chryseobacterium sp. SSA4.19]
MEPEKERNSENSRREFLKKSGVLTALALTPTSLVAALDKKWDEKVAEYFETVQLIIEINGKKHSLKVEPRKTLLDLLREDLQLTGSKKGCDHGQCGACTVHVDGVRVLSCLTLASMQQNTKVTTIEGLAEGRKLHPMQKAFIKHDGFQCGYCTSGQIMSGIACIKEGHANSREEISEYMSGNICRCGAYHNIVDAIQEVKKNGEKV